MIRRVLAGLALLAILVALPAEARVRHHAPHRRAHHAQRHFRVDFAPARPHEGKLQMLSREPSRVLAEAARFVGSGCRVTGFCGPWCKAFTNLVLRRAGYHPSASLLARDALHDGRRVASPRLGDLVVLRGGRHVTFFAGYGGRGFLGLGGNQGHRVALSSYPLRQVVAYVEPK